MNQVQLEMLSEPVVLDDIYVSGLAHVEEIGDGNFRLLFYKTQKSLYGGSEHVIVCRMVATPQAMLAGAVMVLRALGYACCGACRKMLH